MGFATFPGVGELLCYARVSTLEQNVDLQRDALVSGGLLTGVDPMALR